MVISLNNSGGGCKNCTFVDIGNGFYSGDITGDKFWRKLYSTQSLGIHHILILALMLHIAI